MGERKALNAGQSLFGNKGLIVTVWIEPFGDLIQTYEVCGKVALPRQGELA